jgi:hypothetical protein
LLKAYPVRTNPEKNDERPNFPQKIGKITKLKFRVS